jgi:hypothetical protein
MCRVVGGGDLAEAVRDFEAAVRYCKRGRGGCAPSLVSNHRRIHNAYVRISVTREEREIVREEM